MWSPMCTTLETEMFRTLNLYDELSFHRWSRHHHRRHHPMRAQRNLMRKNPMKRRMRRRMKRLCVSWSQEAYKAQSKFFDDGKKSDTRVARSTNEPVSNGTRSWNFPKRFTSFCRKFPMCFNNSLTRVASFDLSDSIRLPCIKGSILTSLYISSKSFVFSISISRTW